MSIEHNREEVIILIKAYLTHNLAIIHTDTKSDRNYRRGPRYVNKPYHGAYSKQARNFDTSNAKSEYVRRSRINHHYDNQVDRRLYDEFKQFNRTEESEADIR